MSEYTPYKMRGPSLLKMTSQQNPYEKRIQSQEFDKDKSENKLDGDKTSTQNNQISNPKESKEKTSPLDQKDKKHIGRNFKKKIVYGKLGKDLKEAESIIVDDVNKLAGTKVHSGTGNKGRGRLIRGTSPNHKYWQKK